MTQFQRYQQYDYNFLNRFYWVKQHCFISDGKPVTLCNTGSVLSTKIIFELLNDNDDKWKITVKLAKYICGGMGSSGIDNTYQGVEKTIIGTGYQSASENLLDLFCKYPMQKAYITKITEGLINKQSHPWQIVLDAGPMPLEFWQQVQKQNKPCSLEHLTWINLEIEKFKKSLED